MNLSLSILLFILVIFIICFIYIEPILSKYKIKSNNEYGSARFSTLKEINKNFIKEKITNIKEVGFPVYYDRSVNYVWFDKDTPHYVYLGSSNSGKTVTSVIPMISFISTAKKKRSIFITDPKGEIFDKTSKMLKDNGYNIITIDFRNPEKSNHINILEPIIKEYEKYIDFNIKAEKESESSKRIEYNNLSIQSYAESNRLITSLSMMVMADKGISKDPFWNNSAKNLLEGLIGFFLEEYERGNIKREQITMTSIRKFQNSIMDNEKLKKFKCYLEQKSYGTKSKDSLIPIITTSENTYKSITSVFSEKMAIFDDVNVANVTYKSDFDFDILGKENTALFVIVPDEDKIYFTLVTIIVGILYKELVKLANKNENKKLPVEIDWLLDEFANCPPFNDIEAMVSVARSRGMHFHFFIQSLSQLNNVYGNDISKIILDNSGLVYLKTNTMETAEEVSKRLGKKTIESYSLSNSLSLIKNDGNKSLSLMARDLLTPDEVKNLHYKTIIFPIIGYPIFRNTVMYTKLSCYSSGFIIRKTKPLIDLSDTYFVVENLKLKNKNNDDNSFYDDLKSFDRDVLKKVIDITKDIVKDKLEMFRYKEINGKTYVSFSLCKELNKNEILKLKAKINKDLFYIKTEDKVIEIHIKSFIHPNKLFH